MALGTTLKEDFLGISRDTQGFGNIVRESLSPATLFGADSLMAKVFSSDEMRNKARGVRKPKSAAVQGGVTGLGSNVELLDRSEEYLEQIASNTKELSEKYQPPTPGGQVIPRPTDEDTIRASFASMPTPMTQEQGKKLIEAVEALSGSMGGGGGLLGGLLGGIGAGGVGMTLRNLMRNPLKNPPNAKTPGVKPNVKTPTGTRYNSAGRLIDSKTGRFVAAPDAAKNRISSQVMNKAKKKVAKKVALKVGAKLATRAALAVGGTATFGLTTLAAGALTLYDVGEAVYSKGARKEYTLANPMATEEEKDAAAMWLIENDPERLGIPEEVPPEKRMAFMEAQEANPGLTAEQFNEQSITEAGGPTEKEVAALQRRITDKTSGLFNIKTNDLSEAQNMIKEAGMEGQVYARQTASGIELETSQQRNARLEKANTNPAGTLEGATNAASTATSQANQPVIINNGGGQQMPAPPGDVIVTLPKTILSLNPSAQRFIAIRG